MTRKEDRILDGDCVAGESGKGIQQMGQMKNAFFKNKSKTT